MAKPTADGSSSPVAARGPMREVIATFSLKAVITSLGGALLTFAIWLFQTSYSNHLEHLRRQSDHGAEFQARVLAITGNVVDQLEAAVDLVRKEDNAAALSLNNHELALAFQQWDTNALLLRNQGAQIFGPRVAPFIYDPNGAQYSIDRCNIMIAPGQQGSAENCGPRREAEAQSLDALLDRLEPHARADDPGVGRPLSFAFNAEAARTMLDRYLECMGESVPQRAADPICQNLDALSRILEDRVELVAAARVDIADAMMAESRVSD